MEMFFIVSCFPPRTVSAIHRVAPNMGVPDSESKGRKLYFAGIRVRPIVVGTLAFLSVAALVMQARPEASHRHRSAAQCG